MSTQAIYSAKFPAWGPGCETVPDAPAAVPTTARPAPVPVDASNDALVVESRGGEILVAIASGRSEREQAFELLASSYKAKGYEPSGDRPYRFTPYHVLPDTITVVASRQGRVCATMSLVPDTRLLGLPMESIYGPEIAGLRAEGRRLGETTCLADRGLNCGEFIRVFIAFIKLVMHYHIRQGGDSWVITVNPRHRNFYLKVLGFEPLGSRRSYPSVQGHPAEAFLLDVSLMKANAPEMHGKIFGAPLSDSILKAPDWSPDEARQFGSLSTQADPRTIEELLLSVQHLGSPPCWRET